MTGYTQEERGLLKLRHTVIWSHSYQRVKKEVIYGEEVECHKAEGSLRVQDIHEECLTGH